MSRPNDSVHLRQFEAQAAARRDITAAAAKAAAVVADKAREAAKADPHNMELTHALHGAETELELYNQLAAKRDSDWVKAFNETTAAQVGGGGGGDDPVAAMVARFKKDCEVTSRDKAGNRVYEVAVGGATIATQLQAAFVIAKEGICESVIVHFANGAKVRLSAENPPVSIPTAQAQPKSTDSQGNPATAVYANGKPMPNSEGLRQVETNTTRDSTARDNGIVYAQTLYTAQDGVTIRKALKSADKYGDDDIVVYLHDAKYKMSVASAREVLDRLERLGMLPPEGEGE